MSAGSVLAGRVRGRLRRELAARRDAVVRAAADRAADRPLAEVLLGVAGPAAPALRARCRTLLAACDRPAPADPAGLAAATEALLADADPATTWLALSVLGGRLPEDAEVLAALRSLRLDGAGAAFGPVVVRAGTRLTSARPPEVEVVRGAVTVDVHHTSRTELATGIQRVARETAIRWVRDHGCVLLGWTDDYTALRRLSEVDQHRALGRLAEAAAAAPESGPAPVVVPWQGTHLTIELATEEPRTARMLGLARWSGARTGVIGFDCVPLTSAETAAEAMGAAFARLLAAVRHTDVVATISEGAAREYRGWRAMLAGAGLPGPDVQPVLLPVDAQEPGAAALEQARARFVVPGLPVVLVVGSHEPRKNHLAVLHAAELLWRRGERFSLLFVGGNAWSSEAFTERLGELRAAGRPAETASALDDALLWAAYRLAHVVLFPSLNEGFGLPVAEALASGTPVITSGYGSMAEIADAGGAVLVDPRDDAAIADALARVLRDDALHAELARQARSRPRRTWDQYAEQLWATLAVGPGDRAGG